MLRPLAALVHRSGLFTYLRTRWREDDAAVKQASREQARHLAEAAAAAVRRELLKARPKEAPAPPSPDPRIDELAQEVRRLADVLRFNAEHRERRHHPALDATRAQAHVRAAVAAAPLIAAPAPHMRIPAVLPDDAYQALLAALPPDSCFSQRDPLKQNFKPRRGQLAPEYAMQAWTFFEQEVVAGALLPALLERFRPHLDEAYRDKYGDRAADVAALPLEATGGRLMLRRPGYHLAPHLDPKRVLVTCLVYLARPGDDEEFGTQFFRLDRPPAIDRTNTYFPEVHGYRCEPASTQAFTPNTAVAFLNHGIAHGARIPESAPADTRRYAYQFYVAPDPDRVAAVVGASEPDLQA